MARRGQREEEEESELDLVPIMNLVLILIPLLLLSVVFLEITVINVTMPQKSIGPPNQSGEPPKRLQLMVSKEGFWLIKGDQAMPPIPKCAGQGGQNVTICLSSPDATELVERYDWLELYNTLMKLKSEAQWNDHEQIEIVAGSDIPFGVLVKAMDVSRFQRAVEAEGATEGTTFGSAEELASSHYVRVDVTDEESGPAKKPLGLFPLVVLGLPTTQ